MTDIFHLRNSIWGRDLKKLDLNYGKLKESAYIVKQTKKQRNRTKFITQITSK
jgi:hypothetical protein